ncbi:MFS transporter [Nguyenibacter sp. L1]|uniref:MFS transporter n=1 Tax=Nguyenibacter sp. L1 TaxID=3049350 RepID=UPI002B46AC38|nr:MFS transporter [Nguyenibacter sp. L1]WRH89461.1 MFS transporter [Nguyenibacter sp. L1]
MTAAAAPRGGRSARLGALSHPHFRRFFLGYGLSLLGSAMVPVALSFAILRRGGTARDVSAVLAAEIVPLVLLLLVGGVAADRLPRRRVLMAADLLRFASQGIMAVLLFLPALHLLPLMVLAALLGAGTAFYHPGRSGLLPELVDAADLQGANALMSLGDSGANLLGPILAGLLVQTAGAAWAIAIDSASYAIGAALLLGLPDGAVPASAPAGGTMLRDLREGWREFTAHLWLWTVIVQVSLFFLLAFGPLQIFGPLLFAHAPDGPARWGGLLSAQGAGAIAGGLLTLHWTPRHPIRAAQYLFLLLALPMLALGLCPSYAGQLAGFLLGGLGLAAFSVLWHTTMQRIIPPERLARVTAYDAFGCLCLLPAGYLCAVPMAGWIGQAPALIAGAAYIALSTGAILLLRPVRMLTLPRPPAD